MLQMSYGHVDRLAKMIPNHPTDPWTLERSLNGVSELAAEYEERAGRQAAVRPGDEARGPAAPRLDPRRGRRDRRPAARRSGPALPRSALGHAGHAVRHEICRGRGPGEVRLPRPQDLVGPEGSRATACRAGRPCRFHEARAGTIRRSTSCSSAATRSACSSWNRRACGGRSRPFARPASATSSRSSRSTGPGPMDNIPLFGDRKNGRVADRISAPDARRASSRRPTASSSTRSR